MYKILPTVLGLAVLVFLPQASVASDAPKDSIDPANVYDCEMKGEFDWIDGALQQNEAANGLVFMIDIKSGFFSCQGILGSDWVKNKDDPRPRLEIIQEPKIGRDLIAHAISRGNFVQHVTVHIRGIVEALAFKEEPVAYETAPEQRGNIPKEQLPRVLIVNQPTIPIIVDTGDAVYTGKCERRWESPR